jgi:REP-associated tyrosine transposase
MSWGLKRFQQARRLHFVTFSCHHREPLLGAPQARDGFEGVLERVQRWYGFYVCGYVVMPEHVHLLISEPERGPLSVALQMLKQNVARQLRLPEGSPFWQPRYYDFNVWSEAKRVEKLRYMHRNPVRRGLVERPEDWKWSSFAHYATGADSVVEIESQWTAQRRERLGIVLHVVLSESKSPPLSRQRTARQGRGTPQSRMSDKGWASPREWRGKLGHASLRSAIQRSGEARRPAAVISCVRRTPDVV